MLWGGRFKKSLNKDAFNFSSSLSFDINLLKEDIQGSIAHAEMLGKTGIISSDDSLIIVEGLRNILKEYEADKWHPDETKFEDIHSAIETRLYELIGEPAGKLHTGRSRNDQVATDLKLWVRNRCDELNLTLVNLQKTLLSLSSENIAAIIPGYTHLQRAQPVSYAFHLLAYVEMFERDKKRILFIRDIINESPLGSGALAGSTLPLDRHFTSGKLGFTAPTGNSLDTVADRDFILDFLNACSIGMIHLSRISEEIILWSSAEWNFVKLSDEFTTGSSLMPQKKNPDMAELTRGKSGRTLGNYVSLSAALKGLPLSYNRDLQEDKEPLFDSFITYSESLKIISGLLGTLEVNKDRFVKELEGDFSLATDLADWLVLQGVPFRKAHEIVGNVVKYLEDNKRNFKGITLEELKKIDPVFTSSALECLDIKTSLERKKTYGSPNPSLVKERIKYWDNLLKHT
ncbi:MAG: argininosuccinate lyase [Ignavibacteriaceae bacterium]